MADLTVILYVFHWFIIVGLCRKPLHYLITWTFGVYFTTTAYLLTDENYKQVTGDWTWFDYVKRFSLFAGYFSYVLVYFFNNKVTRIITQLLLTINVAEGSILAFENYEIFVGIGLAIVTPFSPQIGINNNNKTIRGIKGNILQIKRFDFMSVKWYFRGHLIVIGTWYITCVYFNYWRSSIFTFLTAYLPLILNEYYLSDWMNHFSIRTFALFIGISIDGSFDFKWLNKQPQIVPNNLDIIVRNIIQLVIIATVFGLCILNDKFRGKPPSQNEIKNTTSDTRFNFIAKTNSDPRLKLDAHAAYSQNDDTNTQTHAHTSAHGEMRADTQTHVQKQEKADSKEKIIMQNDCFYNNHMTAKHGKHDAGGRSNIKSSDVISAEPHMEVTVAGNKSIKGSLESFEIVEKTSTQIG